MKRKPQGQFCLKVTKIGATSITDIEETPFGIYPNPTSGQVQLDQMEAEEIHVYDLKGPRLELFSHPASGIDIGHLPSGMYILRIHTKTGDVYAARVMKE